MPTAAPRIWDLADEPTQELIVTMQLYRLLGDCSVLAPQEGARRAADVVTESLEGALAEMFLPNVASEVLRRFTMRLGQEIA